MEFELIDGAYRITKDQSKDLTKFLLEKLEKAGKKTPTGAWSKGKDFPTVYVDGVKKIFRNHKTKKTLNNWGLDDVGLKQNYATDRTNKLKQTDALSKSRNAQMKADIDEMNMFTGTAGTDEEFFIEHDSRVTDQAEIDATKHGADDWHNQHPSKVKTGKTKTALESMANANEKPWRVRTDPETGFSRVINMSDYFPDNYVSEGIVVETLEEAEAIKESIKQGKLINGADPDKVAYLISERVKDTSNLEKALEKFKVFTSIQKSAQKVNQYTGLTKYIDQASDAAKAGKTGKALKAGIGVAAAGSILGLGPAGAAFGAVETAQRTNLYKQTGNKLDGIQAFIAGASTVTGATGIGEVISTPLDIINLVIDAARYERKTPYSFTDRRRYRNGRP